MGLDCLCVVHSHLRRRKMKCGCRSCMILRIWMWACPRNPCKRRRGSRQRWRLRHCLSLHCHGRSSRNQRCYQSLCHGGCLSHLLDGSLEIQSRCHWMEYYLASRVESRKPLCRSHISRLSKRHQRPNSRYKLRLFSLTLRVAAATNIVVMSGVQKMMRISAW
uniref:Uncharacterized protein n=1 Tax=Arundo donax TaxID=35708 RepID=A0A0A9FPT9_ARUDO